VWKVSASIISNPQGLAWFSIVTPILIILAHLSLETMNALCTMLLTCIVEVRFKQNSFVKTRGSKRLLLEVANLFGFYRKTVSME